MISAQRAILIILVVAVCTFATRVLPFLFFGGNRMEQRKFLAMVGISLLRAPHGAPELLAVALVAILHVWKRNNLLSIGLGTVFYMFLIQVVFV